MDYGCLSSNIFPHIIISIIKLVIMLSLAREHIECIYKFFLVYLFGGSLKAVLDAYAWGEVVDELARGNDLKPSPIYYQPLIYQDYSQVTWYGAVMLFNTNSPHDATYYSDGTSTYRLYSMVVYPLSIL